MAALSGSEFPYVSKSDHLRLALACEGGLVRSRELRKNLEGGTSCDGGLQTRHVSEPVRYLTTLGKIRVTLAWGRAEEDAAKSLRSCTSGSQNSYTLETTE